MQPGFTLVPRDPFADAKDTLSSWDKCMAKDYCKWPVIVAIIVGGIIAFSVVWCIARCICCGAECAICCCKCCTCCCGSSSSSHKRMKSDAKGYPPPQPYPQQPYPQQSYPPQQPYASPNPYAEARSFAPPPPPPAPVNTQYSQPAPSMTRRPTNPNFNPQVNPKFAPKDSPEQPQFATFDAHSKPVNEDALPQMPSWSDARDVHVQVEEEAVPEKRGDVEMDRLNYNGSAQQLGMNSVAAGAAGAGMRGSPGGMRGSPGQGRSPVSPNDGYGFPAQNQNTSPPYGASPYGQTGYDQNQNISPASYVQNTYDRRPSPAQNQNISPASYGQTGYDRGPSPAVSYSQYSQGSDQYERRAQQAPYVAPLQPYNMDEASSAHQSYMSPAPAPDRYNSPAPPSYHTNAPRNPDPYAFAPTPVQPYNQPSSITPGYGNGGYGHSGYDPVPNRSQTATPTAYPGQSTYQAFTPGGQQTGVARKPIGGSLREV